MDDLRDEIARIIAAPSDDLLKLLALAGLDPKTDLVGLNLAEADLTRADRSNFLQNLLDNLQLRLCNVSRADRRRPIDLSGADLRRTNLSGANLSGADLSGANLIKANLGGANLSGLDHNSARTAAHM